MQWLIKKLKKQQEYVRINKFSLFGHFHSCCYSSNNHGNHPLHHQIHNITVDENFYQISRDFLELSNGASAIIRIVDSRFKKFASEPIAIDNEKKINTQYLEQILKIISSNYIKSKTTTIKKNKNIKNNNKNSNNKKKKRKKRNSIILSKNSKSKNLNIDNDFVLVEKRYKNFLASFAYSSSKHKETRTIQESIPPSIDAQALIKEINQKFLQIISS
jgi:hypothetical protein